MGEKGGWELGVCVGRLLLAKQITVLQRNVCGVRPSGNSTNSLCDLEQVTSLP